MPLLEERDRFRAVDVGWSLATTRAALEQRAVVIGGSDEERLEGLASLAEGRPSPHLVEGVVRGGRWRRGRCSSSPARAASGQAWRVELLDELAGLRG